jgi:hypothetical protein
LRNSSTRSKINWTWALHSPYWSLCCICFASKHLESSDSNAAISGAQKFEYHDFMNDYMRLVECVM